MGTGRRSTRPGRAEVPDTHPGSAASETFARLIAPPPRAAASATRPAGLIGLEHEFVVRAQGGLVDFRDLVGRLPLGGRLLDPGDLNAHRCDWGGVVTADGAEAEIAIPPLPRRPGFVARLERRAVHARESLRRALPAGVELEGYSTHLSLSMPASLNLAACRLFLSTFAPGLMLLADRADSPGLLVRPRPGRLELATEYASGAQLRAVTAYAAGAALATAEALRPGARALLPPRVEARAVQTADRFGWGLRRDAFGGDLLSDGRRALLRREGGRTIRAQEHLERSWAAARAALVSGAQPADLEAADRMVAGSDRLGLDHPAAFADGPGTATRTAPPSAYGGLLHPRVRPLFTVRAEIATWDTTVFAVAGLWRRAFASVPRASLPRFLRALDRGELDTTIVRYLDAPAEGRLLGSWSQAVQAGLHDALAPGRLLLAAEAPTASDASSGADRFGKSDPRTTPETEGRAAWPRWPLFGFIGVLLLGLAAFALTRGGGTTTPPAPSDGRTTTAAPARTAPPSPSEGRTATGAPSTVSGPRITAFKAVLQPPVTTYAITVLNPSGGPLTYQWTAITSCPGFQPSTAATAAWVHPHPPCSEETFHPGTITVTVRDAAGNEARHVYGGGSAPADIALP